MTLNTFALHNGQHFLIQFTFYLLKRLFSIQQWNKPLSFLGTREVSVLISQSVADTSDHHILFKMHKTLSKHEYKVTTL